MASTTDPQLDLVRKIFSNKAEDDTKEFGSPPNKHDAVEVYYCGSSREAANSIDSGALVVIDQQQPFPWNGPPLNDCFKRLSDPECLRRLQRLQPRNVTRNGPINTRSLKATMKDYHWVSIPTRPRDTVNAKGQTTRKSSFFRKTLQQIQNKLIKGTPKNDDKWNVLNMVQSVPVPYPPFLNTPNCDILHRIDALGLTEALPKTVLSGRNIEFMLLSEGGNHTASHVDDFTPGIFSTCHQGPVGIGWITLNWLKWKHDEMRFKGQPRYMVLHPGQTVYMAPGTIHYVFRKLGDPTTIAGSEELTWAGLRRWLCLLKHQELSETEPEVTADKAGNWVACLVQVVKQRRETQDWDEMPGGREELELVMNTLEVGFSVKSDDRKCTKKRNVSEPLPVRRGTGQAGCVARVREHKLVS